MAEFNKIDSLLQELNSYRPLTEGELLRLREEFLVNFTYNSNAIEGNTLTLQETALIINEGITIDKKPLKDHLEAIGHKDAWLYVEELVKQKVQLSEKIIKEIHSLVLMNRREDRGVYRRVPVTIMGAVHTPPQPYLVPSQMELLLAKYQQMTAIHTIERVSLFHLEFEGIHPFIDGNGRTGRLLLNLELMKDGYPPINIKFADRRRYYDCFISYHSNNSNPTDMILLVAQYLEEELERYNSIVRNANQISNGQGDEEEGELEI
ncbi:MAG: Fic family protein [Bacillota bacterium]|nr:Fic family protein [Bacillota bacterium]